MPPHLAAIVLPCLLGSRRDVVAWRQSVIHDQAKHPLHLPVLARCPFRSIPSHVVRGEDSCASKCRPHTGLTLWAVTVSWMYVAAQGSLHDGYPVISGRLVSGTVTAKRWAGIEPA